MTARYPYPWGALAPFDTYQCSGDSVRSMGQADIDGADAEILKANVIFRAVVCPRGRHLVRFTFHPFAGAFTELVGKLTHVP